MNNETMDFLKGWRVPNPIAPAILTSIDDLDTEEFQYEWQQPGDVTFNDVVKRSPRLRANLGFADLEFCHEHRDELPERLRTHPVLFTNTIAVDLKSGRSAFFYLVWRGSDRGWAIDFEWTDTKLIPDFFLARRSRVPRLAA